MPYLIKQATFEGPLDALLQLIEQQELDITTISLAAVTKQYLGYVEDLEKQHLPEITEWLVIAARLLLLKSRALLPIEQEIEDEDGADLVAQLEEYKKYKQLALRLETELDAGREQFSKPASRESLPPQFVPAGIELEALHQAFTAIINRLPEDLPADGGVIVEQLTMEECINRIQDTVTTTPTKFYSLFRGLRTRLGIIVTFLAILELFKQRQLKLQGSGNGLMVMVR